MELIRSVCNTVTEMKTHERLFDQLNNLKVQDKLVYYCAKVFLLRKMLEIQNPDENIDQLKTRFCQDLLNFRETHPDFKFQDTFPHVFSFVERMYKDAILYRRTGPNAYTPQLLKQLELTRSSLFMLDAFKQKSPDKVEKISQFWAEILEFTEEVRATLLKNFSNKDEMNREFDNLPILVAKASVPTLEIPSLNTMQNIHNNRPQSSPRHQPNNLSLQGHLGFNRMSTAEANAKVLQSMKYAKVFPLSLALTPKFELFHPKYDINALFAKRQVSNMK